MEGSHTHYQSSLQVADSPSRKMCTREHSFAKRPHRGLWADRICSGGKLITTVNDNHSLLSALLVVPHLNSPMRHVYYHLHFRNWKSKPERLSRLPAQGHTAARRSEVSIWMTHTWGQLTPFSQLSTAGVCVVSVWILIHEFICQTLLGQPGNVR